MEFLGNPIGGRKHGDTYVHNILLQLDLDLQKLIGLPKSAFRVRGSQRSGDSLTQDDIGNAFSVQQLFGGGQTYRLVEVQIYHSLLDDHLNLTYGRLSATDDFMTSPLYCQFVNNAFCGQPAETVIELNHQIQLTPYFYVRPDLQYVINPNGLGSIDNALVLGFEAGVTF